MKVKVLFPAVGTSEIMRKSRMSGSMYNKNQKLKGAPNLNVSK